MQRHLELRHLHTAGIRRCIRLETSSELILEHTSYRLLFMKYEYSTRKIAWCPTMQTDSLSRSTSIMTDSKRCTTSMYDSPAGYRKLSLSALRAAYVSGHFSLICSYVWPSQMPACISSRAFHLSFGKGTCFAVWMVLFSVDVQQETLNSSSSSSGTGTK